jgi:hypothetical protein
MILKLIFSLFVIGFFINHYADTLAIKTPLAINNCFFILISDEFSKVIKCKFHCLRENIPAIGIVNIDDIFKEIAVFTIEYYF